MKKKIFSTLLLVVFALASTSMFVSCKDYDDDINNVNGLIKALQTQVSTLESSLQTVKADLATLKAQSDQNKADIASLQDYVKKLVTAEQLAQAIDAAKAELQKAIDGKADKADLDALATRIAAIEQDYVKGSELEKYATINYVDAADKNLQNQIDALKKFQEQIEAMNLSGLITDVNGAKTDITTLKAQVGNLINELNELKGKVGSYPADSLTKEEVESLKKLLQGGSTEVTKVLSERIDMIQFLLNKRLTSIVFKPENYGLGIEAVEAPALAYQPIISLKAGAKGADEYYVYNTQDEYDGPNMPRLNVPTSYKAFRENPWSVIADFKAIATDTYGMPSTAYYNVNPNNADLSNVKFSFYANEAFVVEEVESRTAEKIDMNFAVPVNEKVDNVNTKTYPNGVLSIKFNIPGWEKYFEDLVNRADGMAPWGKDSKIALGRDYVNFIALKAQVNDTVAVNSDWAAVVPAIYHINGLADNAPVNLGNMPKCNYGKYMGKAYPEMEYEEFPGAHLYKRATTVGTMAGAISNPYTHEVVYNDENGIDLAPFVETHYTYIGMKAYYDSYEMTMTPELLEELGLEYRWTVVYYEDGHHDTGESKHIQQMGENSSRFVARSVTADGKTIENKPATREALDREPLVKVELVNKANGHVYEVGYIKLKIVEKLTPTNVTVDFNFGDQYMNCIFEGKTSWSQIENILLAKLGENGYSKQEFEKMYKIDEKVAGVAKRFIDTKGTEDIDPIGTVQYTSDDVEDLQTNVITWKSEESEAVRIMELAEPDEKGISTKDVVTYIRFVKRDGSKGNEIYVKLIFPAGTLRFAVGNLDAAKTLAYWFNLNSDKNAIGEADAQEVRVNVPVPTVADNLLENTEFTKDLHDYFLRGTLKLALEDAAHFSKFAGLVPTFEFTLPSTKIGNATFDAEGGSWTVKGLSGATYRLHLSADKHEILCGTTTIVKMTASGVVTYVEGEIADDILNYKGHKELGELETFTAYVSIVVPDGCYPVIFKNGWFNVRFVRPLDLGQAKPYEVKDAPNEWQEIKLTDLVTVTDWRNYTGDPKNLNGGKDQFNKFDFKYYQIDLFSKLDDIRTDAHLGKDARAKNTDPKNFIGTDWKDIVGLLLELDSTGKILKYKNNSGVVGDFHLFVPIRMSYVFGNYPTSYQQQYSVVTVKKSVDQPTAKKN